MTKKHPMLLPKSHEFTRERALSRSPSDFTALTPAHFLVGGPIHQFPEPSQPSRSVGLSERWNMIQRLRQYFWNRWSTGIYIDFNLGPSGGELSQIFN
ncbi:hypothetical protein TNCV_2279941 [Trichonephila clavipes]|nr:hypothetical protein TNCV_2279941 [Trichonephila clavipes]